MGEDGVAEPLIVQLHLLGGLETRVGESQVRFRTRKVGLLLAFLALHSGRPVSTFTVQQLLWPDSDGDRQSQSFRRAVSDLRDALEKAGVSRDLVVTGSGSLALDASGFEVDINAFETTLRAGHDGASHLQIAGALALYRGCLLEPFEEDWIYAYRRHYEEVYCRSVEALCSRLVGDQLAKEAIRIASDAVLRAPLREEPYTALIRAYAAAGNASMAIQQFEALEKVLDDNFGQTPSAEAIAALNVPAAGWNAGSPKPPESGEAKFYVVREADSLVRTALQSGKGVVLVFGPRQVGKTSLLAASASEIRADHGKVAITDFQAMGKAEIGRQETFYRALIHSLATQLALPYEPSWNEWVGANSNLDEQVHRLLAQVPGPVVWAMDEVDRLFGTDYADDFFGLVRSWHNRRALEPNGPYGKLSLLISYATEAHLFIRDLNQSPFNVGVRVNLRDFSEVDVVGLGNRYGDRLASRSAEVFEITNGHPFLTRRAFAFLESDGTVEDLRELAPREDGPFGEHLKRLLELIRQDIETLQSVQSVIRGREPISASNIQRLWSAGLLRTTSPAQPEFRVPAYREFLALALDGIDW